MYVKVTNKDLEKEFELLWKTTCEELCANYYPNHESTIRYLILDQNKNSIGTIEFIPRNPQVFSIIEDYHKFSENELVPKDISRMYEIGKFSISKDYRGKGFLIDLITLVVEFAIENNIVWYIGVINSRLYKLLSKKYGINLLQVSDEITLKNIKIIPFILNIEDLIKNIEHYKWYTDSRKDINN